MTVSSESGALKLVPLQQVCTCIDGTLCKDCKVNHAYTILDDLCKTNTGFANMSVPKNPSDNYMKSMQWLADRQRGVID